MQTCPNCRSQQLDGAIFCSECGDSLLMADSRQEITAALNVQQRADIAPDQPAVVSEPEPPASDSAISLVVLNSGRRLAVDPSEELLIGRKDNARGIFPDIDLTLDGGYDAGVSRRHAIIMLKPDGCAVEDLNSPNGTFVNGQQVSPQAPMPLNNGDELKLGTLLLRVELSL